MNPVPYGDELSLNVDEEDNRIDIELAIRTAVCFGINEPDAEGYAEGILETVRENWIPLASKYGLTRRQIEEMKPAFRYRFIRKRTKRTRAAASKNVIRYTGHSSPIAVRHGEQYTMLTV